MHHRLSIKSLAVIFSLASFSSQAQNDTLPGVSTAVNKWEQKRSEIPHKVVETRKSDILFQNPQTAADLLSSNGAVFVQKSQLGGGSPMIRGFATNRVLIVVDGVRMNNAIYRSGNLQNVISVDPLSLREAEVVFGPGSLTYGSDAIGGVMDFHTISANLNKSGTKKPLIQGNAFLRGSTANQEKTGHIDLNIGLKKWAFLSSVTYSDFDDLKMGIHGGQDAYLRPEYVERINNRDSILKNNDPRKQVQSGYDQWNFLQKVRFSPNDRLDLQYIFNYAGTGNAPRYDRLIEYRSGRLRYAEWYYGPQLWRSHSFQLVHKGKNGLYDQLRVIAGYQDYAESRNDRSLNSNTHRTQTENVDVYTVNVDADKTMGNATLYYGLEAVNNKVHSTGQNRNINSGAVTAIASRYPDGASWNSYAAYASTKWNFHPKLTFTGGLRFNYAVVKASFDNGFYEFPYKDADIKDAGLTGSAGLVFRPAKGWQLNGNISTGFRVPNIDDLGKLFESTPGNITVPNPDLQSEYAWNFELGIVKHIANKFHIELNGFYTLLDNAIVRRPFSYGGQDSIVYDAVLSRVEALQNVAKAEVWGIQAAVEYWMTPSLSIFTNANYIKGTETDDTRNEQVPLRHATPFYGNAGLRFKKNKFRAELNGQYNAQIKNEDMAPSEQAKPLIYAKDANGKPFSPFWYTLNVKMSYAVNSHALVGFGWENMTNQRYRPYSSGIVAAGSNFILSLNLSL